MKKIDQKYYCVKCKNVLELDYGLGNFYSEENDIINTDINKLKGGDSTKRVYRCSKCNYEIVIETNIKIF